MSGIFPRFSDGLGAVWVSKVGGGWEVWNYMKEILSYFILFIYFEVAFHSYTYHICGCCIHKHLKQLVFQKNKRYHDQFDNAV